MSRYGYVTCTPCRVYMFVGKYVQPGDGRSPYFHLGDRDDPPNSARAMETRALWKFHAEHLGHPITTLVEAEADLSQIREFVEIGGDEQQDVSLEEYTADRPG